MILRFTMYVFQNHGIIYYVYYRVWEDTRLPLLYHCVSSRLTVSPLIGKTLDGRGKNFRPPMSVFRSSVLDVL